MKPRVIYEDNYVIAIDKPAGMPATNAAKGKADTLANWLVEKFPSQKTLKSAAIDGGLVHRLDNDTSGIIIASKMEEAYQILRTEWNTNNVMKRYTCLVLGRIKSDGSINSPIAHHPKKIKKMIAVPIGEASKYKAKLVETIYRVIENFKNYTLLDVSIATGARHQIRCHLASIGHPLAGDRLYQKIEYKLSDNLHLKRQFLHASKISFKHPHTHERVEFTSPLPADLTKTLKLLKNY